MRFVGLFAIAACTATPLDQRSTVVVKEGSEPRAGATVITHRANGEVIDKAITDAQGRAELRTEVGAHVTAYLRRTPPGPADAPPYPPSASLAVTTMAPESGTELVLSGPVFNPTPTAGTLTISSSHPLVADYQIELGCTRAYVHRLPVTIEIPIACLGTDTNLDVLIRAWAPQPDRNGVYPALGYSAARVAMANGVAELDAAVWDTTTGTIPVDLVGVDPNMGIALRSDGLEFDGGLLKGTSGRASIEIPHGFAFDGITVRSWLYSNGLSGVQMGSMIRDVVGAPSAVHIEAGDFLNAVVPVGGPSRDSTTPSLHWSSTGVDADAVYINSDLGGVGWIVVMPPEAGETTLPEFQLDKFGFRTGGSATYYDATDLHGFSEFVAQGLHFEVTLPMRGRLIIPPSGELRFQ
jgi:hypothetical protein